MDPEIMFVAWTRWADMPEIRELGGPWLGLYLWGRFNQPPSAVDRPYPDLPEEVIYVGETKHLDLRPLAGRHHRLAHYNETFPDDGNLTNLYVSVCRLEHFPNGYDDDKVSARYRNMRVFTQYVEAKIYWEYTKKWGRPPMLHYKKSAKASR
jgi:hypothetical protein